MVTHPSTNPAVHSWELNSRPVDHKSNALTTTLPSRKYVTFLIVCQVKVQGQNMEMLQAACQQFLGKCEEDIRRIALETLEGHQRAIMGNMTVEVICLIFRYLFLRMTVVTFVSEVGTKIDSRIGLE